MRKLPSFLLLAIFSYLSFMQPAHAVDIPTGCPSSWGMKLVDGNEISGQLALAQKTYGSSKMYVNKKYKATAGSFTLEGVSQISTTTGWTESWALISKALEQNASIVIHDDFLVKFEGCTDFKLEGDRSPIKVSLVSEGKNFEQVLQEWVTAHDTLNPKSLVSLEAKEAYKQSFNSWLNMGRKESLRLGSEKNISFTPSGSFGPLRNSYGFNYLLVSRIGQDCMYLETWAAYPGEMSLKRGCSYDVVIPVARAMEVIRSNETIYLTKIETINFLASAPTPKPTVSAAASPKPTATSKPSTTVKKMQTIRCQKAKTIKKVMGYNPTCPKGFTKL